MKFIEITENLKATPGEYIFHSPSNQIVLCGAFNRNTDTIRALGRGRMFTDKIQNFKKIQFSSAEQKERSASRCKGCGS